MEKQTPTRLITPETSYPAHIQPALANLLDWSWRTQKSNFMMNHTGGWMGGWASCRFER
jgi:hypothetical protein